MDKTKQFIKLFKKAEKKYGKSERRLAAEGLKKDWQVLITTIMSAQSRDETTIKIANQLFKKYLSLISLSKAKYSQVYKIFRGLNYNKTKAKNVIACAKMLVSEFKGKIPTSIEELIRLPGVGRKTANLVLSEVHKKDSITIDTHCFRLLNVLGIVHTKNPHQTELEMTKIAPKKYWSKINRIFVLWGKDVRGRDKKKLLDSLRNRQSLTF